VTIKSFSTCAVGMIFSLYSYDNQKFCPLFQKWWGQGAKPLVGFKRAKPFYCNIGKKIPPLSASGGIHPDTPSFVFKKSDQNTTQINTYPSKYIKEILYTYT